MKIESRMQLLIDGEPIASIWGYSIESVEEQIHKLESALKELQDDTSR